MRTAGDIKCRNVKCKHDRSYSSFATFPSIIFIDFSEVKEYMMDLDVDTSMTFDLGGPGEGTFHVVSKYYYRNFSEQTYHYTLDQLTLYNDERHWYYFDDMTGVGVRSNGKSKPNKSLIGLILCKNAYNNGANTKWRGKTGIRKHIKNFNKFTSESDESDNDEQVSDVSNYHEAKGIDDEILQEIFPSRDEKMTQVNEKRLTMRQHELRLATMYKKKRFLITPDGNCLVASVAKSVYNDVNRQAELRKRIFDALALPENKTRFKDFIDVDWESFVKTVGTDREFLGHIEIQVLADVLQRRIVIITDHDSDEYENNISPSDEAGFQVSRTRPDIFLSYTNNNHYDLLVSLDTPEDVALDKPVDKDKDTFNEDGTGTSSRDENFWYSEKIFTLT